MLWRGFLRDARGAVAVEFVLIAPVLLLLFVEMTNFGFRFVEEARLGQAAREAAEAALYTQDEAVVRNVLQAALTELGPPKSGSAYVGAVRRVCTCQGYADLVDASCTASAAASCPATGKPWAVLIEVKASMTFRPFFKTGILKSGTLQSLLRVQVR